MKFETNEDIEAPIEMVYRAVSDFANYERSALRRGIEVRPADAEELEGASQGWKVAFTYRGKEREALARLTNLVQNQGYTISGVSGGIHGNMVVDLVALSKKRTRLRVTMETGAKTLSGRLLLQTMKLAKGKLTQRFEKRVGLMAQDLEDGFRTGKLV